MGTDAPQKILTIAVEMFNRDGYENVSLRNIARKADMALGTLTYYFKTKELLLDQVLAHIYDKFDKVFDDTSTGEELIEHLLGSFKDYHEITRSYPFYFRDMNAVLNVSGNQRQRDAVFQKRYYDYLVKSFFLLVESGVLRADLTETDIHNLAMLFVHIGNSWTLSCSPYWNTSIPKMSLGPSMAWLLGSCVSPREKAFFDKLCEAYHLDEKHQYDR